MAYKHVPMSAKKRRHTPMVNFAGLDYSSKRFSAAFGRAIEERDFVLEDGLVQVRQGMSEMCDVPKFLVKDASSGTIFENSDKVQAMWAFKAEDGNEHLVAAVGSILCSISITAEGAEATPISDSSYLDIQSRRVYVCKTISNGVSKSSAFVGMKRLWILSGNGYYCLRFLTGSVVRFYRVAEHFDPLHSEEDTYVPTTTIGITEVGSTIGQRSSLDSVNLLTQYRINKLFGGGFEEGSDEANGLVHRFVLDGPIISNDLDPLGKVSIKAVLAPNRARTSSIDPLEAAEVIPYLDASSASRGTMAIVVMDKYGNSFGSKKLNISVGDPTRMESLVIDAFVILVNITFIKDMQTVPPYSEVVGRYTSNINDFIACAISTESGHDSFSAYWESGASLSSYDGQVGEDTLVLKWRYGSLVLTASIKANVTDARGEETADMACHALSEARTITLKGPVTNIVYKDVSGIIVGSEDECDWVEDMEEESSIALYSTIDGMSFYYMSDNVAHVIYGVVDDFGSSNKQGKITFFGDWRGYGDAPNIEVKFPCHTSGNAGLIDKCTFGMLFGSSGYRNRLFASGNPEHANIDWHSGEITETAQDLVSRSGDFSYFPDTSAKSFGQTDNAIVGYDIVSDGKMIIFKTASDKEPTVYYRTPIEAQVSGVSLMAEEYTVDAGSVGVGAISANSIANFNGDTLFVSSEGSLDGMNVTDSVANSRRYAESRSRLIDPKFKEETAESTLVWTDGRDLYVANPTCMYMTNYRTLDSESLQYEWWKMDVSKVTAMCRFAEAAYFGTSDGKIGVLKNGTRTDVRVCESELQGDSSELAVIIEDLEEALSDGASARFIAKPVSAEGDDRIFRELCLLDSDLVEPFGEYGFRIIAGEDGAKLANSLSEDKDYYVGYEGNAAFVDQSDWEILHDSLGDHSSVPAVCHIEFLEDDGESALSFKIACDLFNDGYVPNGLENAFLAEEVLEADIVSAEDNGGYSGRIALGRTNRDGTHEIYDTRSLWGDYSYSVRCVLQSRKKIKALYVSAPYTAGDIMDNLTVYGWSIANDTNIPGSIEIGVATNDEHLDSMVVMARQRKMDFGFNAAYGIDLVSFDKCVIPHKQTYYYPVSVPFISFALRNEEGENAVLATLQVSYTVAKAAYGLN